MSLMDFRQLCVGRFPMSTTRPVIMVGFEEVIERLMSCGIVGELWVNGSFVTEKINPNDIDFVLRIEANIYDKGTLEQREAIDWLSTNLKITHHCDSYWFAVYPESHRSHWWGEYMQSYWEKQWGLSRSGAVKGIAVIELPEGVL